MRTVEEIGAKMDALGLWERLLPYNWAMKPRGTVFPYFCQTMKGEREPVKVRFLLLEGWQTLHDFLRARADHNFGFYSTPVEFPHLELILLTNGESRLLRHDTGYVPAEATGAQRELGARLLWEAYGVMLRLETDPQLPMKFADEKAVFARVERKPGEWEDAPLEVPAPRPHVEQIAFSKADVKAAQDLPFVRDHVVELDFRFLPRVATQEQRPRCVYGLLALDAATGERIIDAHTSVHPEAGLKGMWESMPAQVLKGLVQHGRIPGEIKVRSGRVFRMLRPLCMELPFKLSLHDRLPNLGEES